jgi:copper chaperone CopZ
MRKVLMTMLLVLSATAMVAKDIRTLVLTTTPQMHCKNCENRVINNLKPLKGIKSVVTSVADQTVTIEYNAKKNTEENIINAFEGFGFKARKLADGEKIVKEAHECKEQSEGGCKE